MSWLPAMTTSSVETECLNIFPNLLTSSAQACRKKAEEISAVPQHQRFCSGFARWGFGTGRAACVPSVGASPVSHRANASQLHDGPDSASGIRELGRQQKRKLCNCSQREEWELVRGRALQTSRSVKERVPLVFSIPSPSEEGSDRAALLGTGHPARVSPSQPYNTEAQTQMFVFCKFYMRGKTVKVFPKMKENHNISTPIWKTRNFYQQDNCSSIKRSLAYLICFHFLQEILIFWNKRADDVIPEVSSIFLHQKHLPE